MLSLLLEEAHRYEERKVGVLVTRLLEATIESVLHALPQPIPVGANHHATAHRRILGELGLTDDVQVPARIIIGSRGDLLCQDDLLTPRPLNEPHDHRGTLAVGCARAPTVRIQPTGNSTPTDHSANHQAGTPKHILPWNTGAAKARALRGDLWGAHLTADGRLLPAA